MITRTFVRLSAISTVLIFSACSNSSGPNTNTQNNTQANKTAKSMTIVVHDEVEQGAGAKILVSVEIDSDEAAIPLADGDSITCQGMNLALDPSSNTYKGAIPLVAQGQQYAFVYIKQGSHNYLADVTVEPRPQITSPQQNATVTRTQNFTIKYVAAAGTAGIASTVRCSPVTLTSPTPESDNGTSAKYDATALPAGGGWVQIIRQYQFVHYDLGYSSITANYYTGKVAGVTWQ